MRRNLVTFLLVGLVCLALANPVQAGVSTQSEITLSTLEVDLWPEYDRPSVLVIYHITLPSSISLPVELKLRMPTEAGDPNAVAVKEADGSLYSLTFTRAVNGGAWSTVTFTATMPEIQVEYYDPRLVRKGNARSFEYTWPGDYSIEALTIQVQQPLGAEAMRTTPSLGTGVTGEDGLVYYTTQAGSLAAGQTFDFTLDYEKTTDALTAEGLQVEPSTPVSSITSSQRTLMLILPWILGGLGVILIVGGIWWYLRSGIGKDAEPTPRRRRRFVISQEDDAIPEGHIYCHHCGNRATPNDRFCRACGTRMRV